MKGTENGAELARMHVTTALGDFAVEATGRGLRAVRPLPTGAAERAWPDAATPHQLPGGGDAVRHARAAAEALRRYAEGEPVRYEGALDVHAPEFHHAVWQRLHGIPFGATATYGEIAAALGIPAEARLVGAALGANPVCILVPCHRVLGADGSLRGFAWGLDLKRRLLAHEGSAVRSLF